MTKIREEQIEENKDRQTSEILPEVFSRLAGILDAEALEMIPGTGEEEGCLLIPYMMNDALEYVLILKNANMTGEYDRKLTIEEADLRRCEGGAGRYALLLKMTDGSRCTVFFDDIDERIRCFRCHEIGHFWVLGDEQWRQLVYILGTIHDKYDYFRERFCNPQEQEMMWLAEFGPMRDYSPIGESIADRYPESRQGIDAMLRLAEECGDREYAALLRRYRLLPLKRWSRRLHDMLQDPARWELYALIWKKLKASQQEYGSRDYGEAENLRIRTLRDQLDRRLKALGFSGEYPRYRGTQMVPKNILAEEYRMPDRDPESAEMGADSSERDACVLVVAAEEHPFTELDRPDYRFAIQLMVSRGPSSILCPGGEPCWNLGFFFHEELNSSIVRP